MALSKMPAHIPTSCEQCEQLFGSFDRYLLPDEVPLRACRYNKNPSTGVRDIPAMAECYPCEARLVRFAKIGYRLLYNNFELGVGVGE